MKSAKKTKIDYLVKHLKIKVYGRVQGVGFRISAQTKAKELGLLGFVRNEPDGTVFIETEGENQNLEKFLEWCKKGPPFVRVKKVEFKYG